METPFAGTYVRLTSFTEPLIVSISTLNLLSAIVSINT